MKKRLAGSQPVGPHVGKYQVNLNDLDATGASSILEAIRNAGIIIGDEIGPMDFFIYLQKRYAFGSKE